MLSAKELFNNMFDQILSKLKTTEQADRLVDELINLKANAFKPSAPALEELVLKELSTSYGEDLLLIIKQNKPVDVQKFINEFIEVLKNLPVLNLTIAFEPRSKSIDHFHAFITQNISKNILMNIEIDPSIVGGAQITFNGKYIDFSLKKLLEVELNTKGSEYFKLLNNNG